MTMSCSARHARQLEEFPQHELLEVLVVGRTRRQRDVASEPVAAPSEILLLVVADDGDHLADDREPDVRMLAATHVDALRRTPLDVLVPPEERELGRVDAKVRDLEHAAAVAAFRA